MDVVAGPVSIQRLVWLGGRDDDKRDDDGTLDVVRAHDDHGSGDDCTRNNDCGTAPDDSDAASCSPADRGDRHGALAGFTGLSWSPAVRSWAAAWWWEVVRSWAVEAQSSEAASSWWLAAVSYATRWSAASWLPESSSAPCSSKASLSLRQLSCAASSTA
jgi:hypothetical protein